MRRAGHEAFGSQLTQQFFTPPSHLGRRMIRRGPGRYSWTPEASEAYEQASLRIPGTFGGAPGLPGVPGGFGSGAPIAPTSAFAPASGGSAMMGRVPLRSQRMGQPLFRQLPAGLSVDELVRKRDALCQIGDRYRGGTDIPPGEVETIQSALDTVLEGLTEAEKGQMINWAKRACPGLGGVIAAVSRLAVRQQPMEPTVEPYQTVPVGPVRLPELPEVPSVDPLTQPSATTTTQPPTPGQTTMAPTRRPVASRPTVSERMRRGYSWTPEASAAFEDVPTCPPGQFWDGRQCRGAVAPGGLPGGFWGGGGMPSAQTTQFAPTGLPSGTMVSGRALEGSQVPLRRG